MKYTIITVSITEWVTPHGAEWLCSCFADYNGKHEFRSISHDTACRLMWELVRKGAQKVTEVNPYTPRASVTETKWIHID